MYQLIILSAFIVASFGRASSCSNTYDYTAVQCQYNDAATCSAKCRNAANSIIDHIADIMQNEVFESFEFNHSAVSFNGRSAYDMLYFVL